jgi:hypothetical protein
MPKTPVAGAPAADAPRVPDSHRDLLERPIPAVLTTLTADGSPRSSLVWADVDDGCPRVNTTLERHKGRDMSRMRGEPPSSIDDTSRYLQVGARSNRPRGAVEHLGSRVHAPSAYWASARRRSGRARRVSSPDRPRQITLDAIHR